MVKYNTILEELIIYCEDVIAGKIVVCRKHRLACERFLRDLDRMENDEEFPYYWNEIRAQKAVKWYKYLKHTKGVLAGQRIQLTTFQKFIVCNIEAWLHVDTDYRRFKYGYVQVGRKNAKSQVEAGMASYELTGRKTETPEIYTLGVERDQAKIVFDEVDLMMTKPIRKRVKVTQQRITDKRSKGFIKHLSKKAGKTGDGKNPQLAIVDEYHAHPTSEMHDVMVSGMGSRKEPFIMIITTAGTDFENKPCYKEYKYVSNILEDTMDNEEYFVMICELDKDDDPKDAKNWIKANPILCTYEEGIDFLRRECKKAYDSGDEEKVRNFLTKNCNIWLKFKDTKYINIDYWHNCKRDIDILETFAGQDCYGGFDLSKTGDLTSLSLEFPFVDEGVRKYAFYSHSFLPAGVIEEKRKTDNAAYDFWMKKGWLTATEANEGLIVDYWAMIQHLEYLKSTYNLNILSIGYDPHNANLLVTELENRDYDMVMIGQSCAKLDEPTRNFRDLVRVGQALHDGNKLLSWSLNNCEEDTNSFGEIKLSKKTYFKRIDPAASCIFSHKLCMGHWKEGINYNELTDEYLDQMGW